MIARAQNKARGSLQPVAHKSAVIMDFLVLVEVLQLLFQLRQFNFHKIPVARRVMTEPRGIDEVRLLLRIYVRGFQVSLTEDEALDTGLVLHLAAFSSLFHFKAGAKGWRPGCWGYVGVLFNGPVVVVPMA